MKINKNYEFKTFQNLNPPHTNPLLSKERGLNAELIFSLLITKEKVPPPRRG